MRLVSLIKTSLSLVMVTLIAACATPTVDKDAPAEQRHGRFSVNVIDRASDRSLDSIQGGFIWLDKQDWVRLDLSNPLGNIIARVEIHDDFATLTKSSGEQIQASDADDLIRRALNNKPLPVSGIRYWVKGELMPNVSSSNVKRNQDKKLQSFKQADWQVKLSNYDEQGPTLLDLSRLEATERIKVRIKVDAE